MNRELDLKIEELFRWTGEIEIKDNDDNIVETLYQRIIGDNDLDKTRIQALKASRELRKNLQDTQSDEFLAFLPFHGEKSKEELIASIMFSKYMDFRRNALLNITERVVKDLGEEPTLEEQEQHLTDLETARQDYEKDIGEYINRQGQAYTEELEKLSYDKIFETYIELEINMLCRKRMIGMFDEYAAFLGTYIDPKFKTRRFTSFEEFGSISPAVKNLILSSYRSLPVSPEDLKK